MMGLQYLIIAFARVLLRFYSSSAVKISVFPSIVIETGSCGFGGVDADAAADDLVFLCWNNSCVVDASNNTQHYTLVGQGRIFMKTLHSEKFPCMWHMHRESVCIEDECPTENIINQAIHS